MAALCSNAFCFVPQRRIVRVPLLSGWARIVPAPADPEPALDLMQREVRKGCLIMATRRGVARWSPGVHPLRTASEPITGVLVQALAMAGTTIDPSALDQLIPTTQIATRFMASLASAGRGRGTMTIPLVRGGAWVRAGLVTIEKAMDPMPATKRCPLWEALTTHRHRVGTAWMKPTA
jgi:hypothetical protein